MKVLVTCQSSAMGGVERRLETEVAVIQEKGWQSIVSVPGFKNQASWRQKISALGGVFLEWNPYKFIERQQTSVFWKFLAFLKRKKIIGQKFDLAHVALPWTTVGMTRLYEISKAKVPAVLALHCTYPMEIFPEKILLQIKESLQGVVAAYAVSDSVRESFLSNFGEYCSHFDIDVIHNGISCDAFIRDDALRNGLRKKLAIADDEFLLLFCGRLSDMKRPEFALRIMSHASFEKSKVKMLFVGEGEKRDALLSYVENNGMDDRVLFMGFVENTREIYSAADAYVSTSENREGFPLAASEALAAGLPLFLPDYPVFVECFGECRAAHFFDGSDPEEWVGGILSFSRISQDEIRIYAQDAMHYARSRLDVSIMKNRINKFYDDVSVKCLSFPG